MFLCSHKVINFSVHLSYSDPASIRSGHLVIVWWRWQLRDGLILFKTGFSQWRVVWQRNNAASQHTWLNLDVKRIVEEDKEMVKKTTSDQKRPEFALEGTFKDCMMLDNFFIRTGHAKGFNQNGVGPSWNGICGIYGRRMYCMTYLCCNFSMI